MRKLTYLEWIEEGNRRFGPDRKTWKFICPACGHTQCLNDFIPHVSQKTALKMIGFSCVGRVDGHMDTNMGSGQPCNYAGGGLFGLNPIEMTFEDGRIGHFFEFAPRDEKVVSNAQS